MAKDIGCLPSFPKTIADFLYEEEGSMNRGDILLIGSLIIVVGVLFSPDNVFAGHSSHASHASHESHASSSTYDYGSGHASHVSHVSHASHTSSSVYDYSTDSSNSVQATPVTVEPQPTPQQPQIPLPTPKPFE